MREVAAVVPRDRHEHQRHEPGAKAQPRAAAVLADREPPAKHHDDGRQGAEQPVRVAGRTGKLALGEMQIAERDGQHGRQRRAAPQQRRRAGQLAEARAPGSEIERHGNDHDADRQMQRQHMEAAEE